MMNNTELNEALTKAGLRYPVDESVKAQIEGAKWRVFRNTLKQTGNWGISSALFIFKQKLFTTMTLLILGAAIIIAAGVFIVASIEKPEHVISQQKLNAEHGIVLKESAVKAEGIKDNPIKKNYTLGMRKFISHSVDSEKMAKVNSILNRTFLDSKVDFILLGGNNYTMQYLLTGTVESFQDKYILQTKLINMETTAVKDIHRIEIKTLDEIVDAAIQIKIRISHKIK